MLAMFILLNYLFVHCVFTLSFRECVVVPEECPNKNITYWFYTKSSQDSPIQLDITHPETIRNSEFIPQRPFKILIHGYTGWKDYSPNTEIRPALFQNGEYNVISVDYSPIVKEPCYISGVKNVKIVANCTAQLIDFLVTKRGIKLNRFHVIGFSLGAHVAGTICEYLVSGKLDRISGLDPALPLFFSRSPKGQLDKTDAKFVDVIHTNALVKGKKDACGHIDFYCNGGMSQPGCNAPNVEYVDSCNHARAPAYYAESINSKLGFWGNTCSKSFNGGNVNCKLEIMGFDTPHNATGTYYVTTNSASEFAQGRPKAN